MITDADVIPLFGSSFFCAAATETDPDSVTEAAAVITIIAAGLLFSFFSAAVLAEMVVASANCKI